VKKLQTKIQKYRVVSSKNTISRKHPHYVTAKKPDGQKKNSQEDEQTLAELSSAHRRSQAKCQLVQTSYIKRVKLFLFVI